jgi:transposase-like protein
MSGVVASRRYPQELKERAVRMVAEIRGDHESEWAAMGQVADLLGVGFRRNRPPTRSDRRDRHGQR